jgi:hypothetical protein
MKQLRRLSSFDCLKHGADQQTVQESGSMDGADSTLVVWNRVEHLRRSLTVRHGELAQVDSSAPSCGAWQPLTQERR